MAATIYLHWTATGYDWIRPGHYHRIIGGDGRDHRLQLGLESRHHDPIGDDQ